MTTQTCPVCGDLLTDDRAACNTCGREFHLALRTDRPAKDCGDAWLDEESQALIFACHRCLSPGEPTGKKTYRAHMGSSAREIARSHRKRRGGAKG